MTPYRSRDWDTPTEKRRLTERLEQKLMRIEDVVSQYTAPNQIEVGGGSVLEARWQHRESTDIDLFTTRARMREWAACGTLTRMCRALAMAGATVNTCNAAAGWAKGKLGGTEWSLGASAWAKDPGKNAYDEGFRAMETQAIIAAKLFGRIAATPTASVGHIPRKLVLRDAYDLAVLPSCAPGVLDAVLAEASPDELHRVWITLDATDTRALKEDYQKLIRPRYKVNIDRVALVLAHAVTGGGERSMPVPDSIGETVKRREGGRER